MDPIYIVVGQVGDVGDGEMKAIELSGRNMILANVGGVYRVFARECPHEWVDLIDGDVYDNTITCAQHGYEFDLTSGECVTPLTWCTALTVVPTEVRGDEICARLEIPAP